MKTKVLIWPLFLFYLDVFGQVPIYDRTIVSQQERMVYKHWADFYPRANRVLGVPSNPAWYLTWAFHTDYDNKDKRPLSARGPQTQRLGLAAAMKISSDHYKEHSDEVRKTSLTELARISGEVSQVDPLYILYYRKELEGLDDIESSAFNDGTPQQVQTYLKETGAFAWYVENMNSLAERFDISKKSDMERGQRILMYHRILLDYRKLQKKWVYRKSMSQQMLVYREAFDKDKKGKVKLSNEEDSESIMDEIINRKVILK